MAMLDPCLSQQPLDTAPAWVRATARSLGLSRLVAQHLEDAANGVDDDTAASDAEDTLVASDRVLQYLDADALTRALDAARRVGRHGVFRISTRYSSQPLVNGHNEFASVHDSTWWCGRIASVFGHAALVRNTPHEYCVIVTAPISPALADEMAVLSVRQRRHAVWSRRRQRLLGRLWRLVRRPLPEDKLLHELAGQRVALVGGAASLAQQSYGQAIDAADRVVRCNRGVLVSERSHGRRTDWLITALPISRATAERRGVRRLAWVSRRPKMMRNIPAWMFATRRLHILSKRRDRALAERLGKTASTGMKALELLAASPCARLDIYGFDFGDTRSDSQPTRPMSSDHDFEAERRYARYLIEADSRLHLHT